MSNSAENNTPATEELKPKTRLTGKVVKTTLAGAILDLGQSLPGIIHISQLTNESIKRVEDVVQEGQSVDVWVRKVKADRIEVTMIEPLGLEWRELKPEMVVKGKVARLETYGAFVEIGAERPGLVHISEMAHGFVKTPQEVVKEGDEVEVKILDVDRKKHQIRLSMKALLPEPEEKPRDETPRAERGERAERPARGPKAERGERSDRPKRGGAKKGPRAPRAESYDLGIEESSEPEPTAFEMAWQAAMERSKAEKAARSKKARPAEKTEQEDIFDRTLKSRLPTA